MKAENSILNRLYTLMDFSYDQMHQRLEEKFELSLVDGYLQISYHCK